MARTREDAPQRRWTTERQPGDDEECERLDCEDRTHPVYRVAAGEPELDVALLRVALETILDTWQAPNAEAFEWLHMIVTGEPSCDPGGPSEDVADPPSPAEPRSRTGVRQVPFSVTAHQEQAERERLA